MSFITKFLFIIFFNFIILRAYALDIPNNLIIQVIVESQNQISDKYTVKTKNSDLISVKYTGWIFDSNASTTNHCDAKGEMFDSNVYEKFNHLEPFQFVLGKGIVIKGWDLGLQDMRVTEQRCLVIPAHLAYGNRRIGNIIKPNSTLIFEVKLTDIIRVE